MPQQCDENVTMRPGGPSSLGGGYPRMSLQVEKVRIFESNLTLIRLLSLVDKKTVSKETPPPPAESA